VLQQWFGTTIFLRSSGTFVRTLEEADNNLEQEEDVDDDGMEIFE
jgi:hypothetical protein